MAFGVARKRKSWFPQKTPLKQPDNEAQLIATGEVWQIAAFADLYAEKVAKSLPLKQDYARARRLYEACLRLGGEEGYFRKKMEELEAVWKERGE